METKVFTRHDDHTGSHGARRALVVLATITSGTLGGCASSPTSEARRTFLQAHTCPAERVSVLRRDDITPHLVLHPRVEPSAEIAADPERLAMWQQRMQAGDASIDRTFKAFEVSGCGVESMYLCSSGDGSVEAVGGGSPYVCVPARAWHR